MVGPERKHLSADALFDGAYELREDRGPLSRPSGDQSGRCVDVGFRHVLADVPVAVTGNAGITRGATKSASRAITAAATPRATRGTVSPWNCRHCQFPRLRSTVLRFLSRCSEFRRRLAANPWRKSHRLRARCPRAVLGHGSPAGPADALPDHGTVIGTRSCIHWHPFLGGLFPRPPTRLRLLGMFIRLNRWWTVPCGGLSVQCTREFLKHCLPALIIPERPVPSVAFPSKQNLPSVAWAARVPVPRRRSVPQSTEGRPER